MRDFIMPTVGPFHLSDKIWMWKQDVSHIFNFIARTFGFYLLVVRENAHVVLLALFSSSLWWYARELIKGLADIAYLILSTLGINQGTISHQRAVTDMVGVIYGGLLVIVRQPFKEVTRKRFGEFHKSDIVKLPIVQLMNAVCDQWVELDVAIDLSWIFPPFLAITKQ